MMLFDSILIASDVDGTLAFHGVVSPRNLVRIREFIAQGGKFCLSTGRNHKDIYRVVPGLSELVNAPCILCNGSYLYDVQTDEITNPHYLDPDDVVRVLTDIRRHFPTVGFRGSYQGGLIACRDDEVIRTQLTNWGTIDLATFCEFSHITDEPMFKAVCVGEPVTLRTLEIYLREQHYDKRFTLTRSSDEILEFQPLGVSKSFQMDNLHALYPNRTLYAVGDFDNDADMLRHADIAACPANATDPIKEICAISLCHCSEGAIADLIDKIEDSLK